jgi:hypothetical protein
MIAATVHGDSKLMGRSVWSSSGVLLPMDSLRPLFRSRALARGFAVKLRTTGRLDRVTLNGRIVVPVLWEETARPPEDRGSLRHRLETVVTGDDLFEILRDCVLGIQRGGVNKYGHTYFEPEEWHDLITTVWNDYIRWFNHGAGVKLPKISKFETFGSGRNSGWAVEEYGVPYVLYAPDAIFSQRLTGHGRVLEEYLGKRPQITTWSNVSE